MSDDLRRALEIMSVVLTVVVAAPAVRDEWKRLQERIVRRRVEQAERDARFYAAEEAMFASLYSEVLADLRIITSSGAPTT